MDYYKYCIIVLTFKRLLGVSQMVLIQFFSDVQYSYALKCQCYINEWRIEHWKDNSNQWMNGIVNPIHNVPNQLNSDDSRRSAMQNNYDGCSITSQLLKQQQSSTSVSTSLHGIMDIFIWTSLGIVLLMLHYSFLWLVVCQSNSIQSQFPESESVLLLPTIEIL